MKCRPTINWHFLKFNYNYSELIFFSDRRTVCATKDSFASFFTELLHRYSNDLPCASVGSGRDRLSSVSSSQSIASARSRSGLHKLFRVGDGRVHQSFFYYFAE